MTLSHRTPEEADADLRRLLLALVATQYAITQSAARAFFEARARGDVDRAARADARLDAAARDYNTALDELCSTTPASTDPESWS